MKEILIIDPKKIVLSGDVRIFKTAMFLASTAHFLGIDKLVSKFGESVILSFEKFTAGKFYRIDLESREHSFFFTVFGRDIIFFKYSGRANYVLANDSRLESLIDAGEFMTYAESVDFAHDNSDFKKMYRVFPVEKLSYPYLNDTQRGIVETEDKNMLVQGAPGSGKTNICIDKIIFSACRGYSGRVLYSTFSRGLLIDTQTKILEFASMLEDFVKNLSAGDVVFCGTDKIKAVENKLGIYLYGASEKTFSDKIKEIANFLKQKVDFFLIEDLYAKHVSGDYDIADETFFVKQYMKDIKNHQLLSKFSKIAHLSCEVIYKEIYGAIFGCFDISKSGAMLTEAEYCKKRENSFSRTELEVIYGIAKDYNAYLAANKLLDNNTMSRFLIGRADALPKYSVAILDEVQDMTEINLYLMKKISLKMFCVGDAQQMISPSYFSFAYLKRLLFEKDITPVSELSNNYRNSGKIASILDNFSKLNASYFGLHSFLLSSIGYESGLSTTANYLQSDDFLSALSKTPFNNYTVIVSDVKEKEILRKVLPKQEILTVAEIKGLERDVVILYNLLSKNIASYKHLERMTLNRKQADENSVFRYYFNMFYVGVSRAKTHIYVAESLKVSQFAAFLRDNFENIGADTALERLKLTSNKEEADEEEFAARAEEFIKFGQYDNARFAAGKVLDARKKNRLLIKTDVFEKYIAHGRYKDAGISYWEQGLVAEAREQFVLANETELIGLLDAASSGGALDIGIVKMLPDLMRNNTAKSLIFDTIKKDLEALKNKQTEINRRLKNVR